MDVNAAVEAIDDVVARFGRLVEDGSRRLGLTPVRARVLFAIHEHGPGTQRSISRELAMSAQQMGVIVDSLVERGLVDRQRDPDDRRAQRVGLTPQGEELVERIVRMRGEVGHMLVGQLDDDERAELVRLLQRVTEQTDRMLGGHH